MIKPIQQFIFTYTPWNIESKFPIESCQITIVAESRKEAELIALKYKHVFFNEDCTCEVKEGLKGYRE